MATKANAQEIDAVTCSICKEIFLNPVKISCGHTFCEKCIDKCWKRGDQVCPVCRKNVDSERKVDIQMLNQMATKSASCRHCNATVILQKYRLHVNTCGAPAATSEYVFGASGAAGTSSSGILNRYTFPCPYCQEQNLDRESLLEHVNQEHKGDTSKIVCPICKVMPWGDIQQYSQDFHQHLNIRHKFDYDRFVDFNQDEDISLRTAVKLSMKHY